MMLPRTRWLGILLTLVCLGAVAQAIEPLPFKDHAQELRFQHLTSQLRCPMCQNETLADSNAPIAHDLRATIFRLMQQGSSDQEIKHYLVERYSNFVLYDPPLNAGTWLLWFGPALLFLVGVAAVILAIRRRARMAFRASAAEPVATLSEGDDW